MKTEGLFTPKKGVWILNSQKKILVFIRFFSDFSDFLDFCEFIRFFLNFRIFLKNFSDFFKFFRFFQIFSDFLNFFGFFPNFLAGVQGFFWVNNPLNFHLRKLSWAECWKSIGGRISRPNIRPSAAVKCRNKEIRKFVMKFAFTFFTTGWSGTRACTLSIGIEFPTSIWMRHRKGKKRFYAATLTSTR